MQVFNHSLYQFYWDQATNTLQFAWTEEQPNMQYEDFQEACANYAGFAFEYRAKNMLIDARNFVFELPLEYKDWVQVAHLPRLMKAGLNKMAQVIQEA